MPRSRHPNKHIEAALQYAEANGWEVTQASGGHSWGYMLCTFRDREGWRKSIYSTPRNPENHSRTLKRAVDTCPHTNDAEVGLSLLISN